MFPFNNFAFDSILLILSSAISTSEASWCPQTQQEVGFSFREGYNDLYGHDIIYRNDDNTEKELSIDSLDSDECITFIDPTARLPSGFLIKYHAFISVRTNLFDPPRLQIWRHIESDEKYKLILDFPAFGPLRCDQYNWPFKNCQPIQEGDLLGWTDCGGFGVSRNFDSARSGNNSTLKFTIEKDDLHLGTTLDDDGHNARVTFSLAATISKTSCYGSWDTFSSNTVTTKPLPSNSVTANSIPTSRRLGPAEEFPQAEEEGDKKKDSGLSGGIIAAIVVSVVFGILLLLCIFCCCCFAIRKRKTEKEGKLSTEKLESASTTNTVVNNQRTAVPNRYKSEFDGENRKNEIKNNIEKDNIERRFTTSPSFGGKSKILKESPPTPPKPRPKTTGPDYDKASFPDNQYTELGLTTEYLSPAPEYRYTSLIFGGNNDTKALNDKSLIGKSSSGLEANKRLTLDASKLEGETLPVGYKTPPAKFTSSSGKSPPENSADVNIDRNVGDDGYLEMIYK